MFVEIGLALLSLLGTIASPLYIDEKTTNYLMTFGYLPESNRELQNLREEGEFRDSIRTLQEFAGIPITGEIDDATKNLMAKKRCGRPDSEPRIRKSRHRRYTLHGNTWKHTNLTWSLRTPQPGGLDTGTVRSELDKALDLWARNSKLTFQEVNDPRADILVFFHRGYHNDGYPFDGRGKILAHAFFPGPDRGGDAHFDVEEKWLLGDDDDHDGTSLFAVAAHEFGHSLGLAHSSVRGALMYPWYQGFSTNYILPEDDRIGIHQMYGHPEGRLWANIPGGQPPTERPPRTRTTTTTTTIGYPRRPRPSRPSKPTRPINPNLYPDEYPYRPYRPGRYPGKPDYTTERPAYRPERPRPRVTIPKSEIPNNCDTSYDAISLFRGEIYIFKGKYIWRIGNGGLYSGYPVEITRQFNISREVDHVDAVYERTDGKLVFFIGKQYYLFYNSVERGYPKPLTYLGLPESLEKIDGAMVWGHNSKTYFFSGTMYWRFDDRANRVELDYPRDMSIFDGVGYNIDTVFQWKDGKTYFFKGKGYWEFDDLRMRVKDEKQKLSALFWMNCPREAVFSDGDSNMPSTEKITSHSSSTVSSTLSAMLLAVIIILQLV